MGELHLEVLSTRIVRDYRVPVTIGTPRVSYREGVIRAGEGEGSFSQTVQQRHVAATVRMRLEPCGDIEPRVVSGVDATTISMAFLQAALEGVRGGLSSGPFGGYPMIHVAGTVLSAAAAENAGADFAFAAAAEAAVREALAKAGAQLYEPVMALAVETPEEFLGGIIHDLNGRRAEIVEIGERGKLRVVKAKVALAETFGYATAVRGLSTGRASYSLEPLAYVPVPRTRAKTILGYDPDADRARPAAN